MSASDKTSLPEGSQAEPLLEVDSTHHDPYRALRSPNFLFYIIGSFIFLLGQDMMTVAIGWELYERTNSPLALGLVGLVLIIPVFCFSLPAGHIADHFQRKRVLLISLIVASIAVSGLAILSYSNGPILLMYACLLVVGSAGAFAAPASGALLTQLIDERMFESAVTWQSSSGQLAAVVGPASGGFAIALFHHAAPVYVFYAASSLIFILLLLIIRERPYVVVRAEGENATAQGRTWRSFVEGWGFVRKNQIITAAITLDMVAVLLGGATMLLPVFTRDVLLLGPTELGWLRAAPSLGAICMALLIAHRPPFRRAGLTLLLAVIGFGLATIVFGLSRSFWLSLLALFFIGAFDNISVVIRSTLLLIRTPDRMRGRVSAVNALFIGASNELGSFESGLAAQFLGPTLAVVGGGVGTILVVIIVAIVFPALRLLTTLREK